jgi:hypothetical protein
VTPVGRLLVTLGLLLVAVGLLLPWFQRLGLGRLPGDITIERDAFHIYLPLTSGLLVSVVLSALVWLFRR